MYRIPQAQQVVGENGNVHPTSPRLRKKQSGHILYLRTLCLEGGAKATSVRGHILPIRLQQPVDQSHGSAQKRRLLHLEDRQIIEYMTIPNGGGRANTEEPIDRMREKILSRNEINICDY